MESALILRMEFDNGIVHSNETIDGFLSSSELIRSLTNSFSKNSLYPIWRLIALSEIPYAGRLKYTKDLIEYIEMTYATSEGFSITGKCEDLLPCYNAMLVEAFSKLGCGDRHSVRSAIEWIKRYQVLGRNEKTAWSGSGITKYGGCMKSTPCYIGIAKSVKALIYYTNISAVKDYQITKMIERGTNYLLQHHLYQRLSNNDPITKHILNIAYPQSYQLNIVELLDVAFMTKNLNDPGVKQAIDYIKSKMTKDGMWKINYIYKANGYISFDKRGQAGEWVTYILKKYLGQVI